MQKTYWKTFNLIPILTSNDACFHLRTMEFTLWFVGLAAGLGLRLVMGEKFIKNLEIFNYVKNLEIFKYVKNLEIFKYVKNLEFFQAL